MPAPRPSLFASDIYLCIPSHCLKGPQGVNARFSLKDSYTFQGRFMFQWREDFILRQACEISLGQYYCHDAGRFQPTVFYWLASWRLIKIYNFNKDHMCDFLQTGWYNVIPSRLDPNSKALRYSFKCDRTMNSYLIKKKSVVWVMFFSPRNPYRNFNWGTKVNLSMFKI